MQPEENVYFECHHHYTEPFIKEYNKLILFTSAKYLFPILWWPFYALVIALLCVFEVFSAYTALAGIAISVIFALVRSRQKKSLQKFYKGMLITNNNMELREHRQFTQLGCHTKNSDSGNQQFLSYEHLTGFVEGPDLAALVTSVNSWYVIDLRTLTGGTREEFSKFLWQHCPLMKRKKKLHKNTGKVINAVVVATLVLSLLLTVLQLPDLYIKERLFGTISNHLSYQQIADKLEDVGITGADDELIAYLEEEYGDLKHGNYYSDAEVLLLLSYLGEGNYDDHTGWSASKNGVYWFDLECWDPSYMYTYCLEGIAALGDGELKFTSIQEQYSDAVLDSGTGKGQVRFTFNGEKHTIPVTVNYDWFDPTFLDALNQIIGSKDGKQLYFAPDAGQGILVFYRDAQWAKEFTRLTGISLCTKTADLRY